MFEDCPVKVWQDPREFAWLYEKVKSLSPETILEIGSYKGGTIWNWIKLNPELIISVDIAPLTLELQKIWASWITNGTELRFIRGESQAGKIVNKIRAEMVECDFLFIDGDHNAHRAQHDWDAYWPMVRQGGMCAFHDIIPNGIYSGVSEVWQKIKDSGLRTEEIILNQDIMGIGVVWKD